MTNAEIDRRIAVLTAEAEYLRAKIRMMQLCGLEPETNADMQTDNALLVNAIARYEQARAKYEKVSQP